MLDFLLPLVLRAWIAIRRFDKMVNFVYGETCFGSLLREMILNLNFLVLFCSSNNELGTWLSYSCCPRLNDLFFWFNLFYLR